MGRSTIDSMPLSALAASPRGDSEPRGSSLRSGDAEHLTLLEVAHATGRNVELLRRWCIAGRIPCERLGRDWFIDQAALPQINAMPSRRVSEHRRSLDDRSVLNRELNREVDDCLEPGEQVRVVVPGVEASGLVVTDRKVLVVRDGVLVASPKSRGPAVWPLTSLRRVQFDQSSAAGALVITPVNPDDRALVVLLARPHLAQAEAAADAIRGLLESVDETRTTEQQ